MRRLVLVGMTLVGLVAGCGGGSKRTVSLDPSGAADSRTATACGKTRAFWSYPTPGSIPYTGEAKPAPSGQWKLEVKLKRCTGERFVDVATQKIVGESSGRFNGAVPVGQRGSNSIRAKLSAGGSGESRPVHLKVG